MGTPAFCYQNLFESASTVTASSEATGFLKENAYDWRTDDWWKPDSTSPEVSTLTADMGGATAADYGAIYAHDLHTQGATIKLQWGDGASPEVWTTVFTVTPTTSAPIVRIFASLSKQRWRYEITGGAAPQSIGVLAFGARLDMEQGMRPGFTPPTYARTPHTMPHQAQQGAFVGMSIKRRGIKFNADFNVATPAWLRSNWGTFQDHFESKPFFFTWDPTNYEGEAVYCWLSGTAPPPVYNMVKYLGLSMPMLGLYL